MPSPFPGMDPYLEPHWLDIHAALVNGAKYALNDALPDDLLARSEEHVGIDDSFDPEKIIHYRPDVRVIQPGLSEPDEAGGVVISAPMKLVVDPDLFRERFVQIARAGDGQLVTIIEFLSPSNKVGRSLSKYLKRRSEFIDAGVHVVEIDLVRRGDWRAILEPHDILIKSPTIYRATVRPGGEPETVYVYPIRLNEPLPSVVIPLRPNDPEVKLALQPLIARAYDGGRYARTLDYSRPPEPPLDPDDAAWAATLIKSIGAKAPA